MSKGSGSGGVRLSGRILYLEVDPKKVERAMERLQNGQGISGARRLAKLIRQLVQRHGGERGRGYPKGVPRYKDRKTL